METADNKELCSFCHKSRSNYTCPRCNAGCCSLACYQVQEHADCSESFYQKCVMEEMPCNDENPSKQKIIEALHRMQELDEHDDNSDLLDSDDDADCTSLADRLKGVNLDDAKEVWKRLKDDERQQFQALLRSGDINALIKEWEPWWLQHESKIQELDNITNYKNNCPKIKEDIKSFNTITTKPPAECVRHNLINILSAYAVVSRYFNGCHFEFLDEAVNYIILLSLNLKDNLNFEDADSAIGSVQQECIKVLQISPDTENMEYIKEDTDHILQGPNVTDKNYYLLCGLSEVHNLLSGFLKKKSLISRHTKSDHLQRVKMKLYLKKIEYFLSYVSHYVK
ncbi:hypothetical protein ILUMI_23715 [Ignelater luminosus]|uniref:HIT-type domain-containing protein n=1 Tax=Ignelater luminosus TaxID=2038154 RepID=A0A8K0CEW4_IGNLU|nr:hypothetical protein ILUMI_23715 [Ignelater luminosus]